MRTTDQELCIFLARYCAVLLGAGATCIRLTRNAERIARAFGRRARFTVMPRHVHVSVMGPGETEVVTCIEDVPGGPVSFNVNTRLSLLSWEIYDRRLSMDEARRRFELIIGGDRQSPGVPLLLASLANASFCRLFGGDAVAMLVVFVATLCGYHLKQLLLGRHVDTRVVFVACAFLSSVIAAADGLFGLGTTPDVALGTSVLYLVPGIPFLNSFSDLLYRHYICAFSRMTDAVILTGCLSAGLCAGMSLMHISMF